MAMAKEGDLGAVRRPRECSDRSGLRNESPPARAIGANDPQASSSAPFPVLAVARQEGDEVAARRPRGGPLLPGLLRQARRGPASQRLNPDARPGGSWPNSDSVDAVAHRLNLVRSIVAGWRIGLQDDGNQALSVGRPLDRANDARNPRGSASSASIHIEDSARRLIATGRDDSEPPSVRRPSRCSIGDAHRGKTAPPASVDLPPVDLVGHSIGLRVEVRDLEGYTSSIGRQVGVSDPTNPVPVVGSDDPTSLLHRSRSSQEASYARTTVGGRSSACSRS